MPVERRPLFRPEVIQSHLGRTDLSLDHVARSRLRAWSDLLSPGQARKLKESELLPDWISDILYDVLGYAGPAQAEDGRHTLSREQLVQVDGKFADAVLGDFRGTEAAFLVAFEGKGPLDPLDRPHAGRRMSAVDQAYRYAINLPCDWVLVSSMREIRLYSKKTDQRTYERWLLDDLASNDEELRRFVYILGAERVVPASGSCHLYGLLEESERAGEEVTQKYYAEYAAVRRDVLNLLIDANRAKEPRRIIQATQRLLDRVLFIAFAEDRGLLPKNTLAHAFEHRDPYLPRPVWTTFQALFRAIDDGSAALGVPKYNGGLFRRFPPLDGGLDVPDAACERLKRLGEFNYSTLSDTVPAGDGPQLDVEILGHVFEQSIEDLEVIRAELEGGEASRQTSKRKRQGAFYTPRQVTSLIVRQALRPVLEKRFERLRQAHIQEAIEKNPRSTQPRVLEDPRSYNLFAINEPQREALTLLWEAWLGELATIRIVDPACGSGAFLVEAFDQMHAEYEDAIERLVDLRGQRSLFDPDREILQHNLYGVDLNGEAVEIARLSIWIKTARKGKVLADLDHPIREGNSIVTDPSLDPRAFRWRDAFPEVFSQGGFDVVVGNPPYVRADHLTEYKEYLEEHYGAYRGDADLYVYFYELGLRLLRPGGRLSFVVTNKWLKAGYAEPLRRLFAEKAWVESIVDLGHARHVFPDADVFPSILLAQKPGEGVPVKDTRVCVIPRSEVDLDDLSAQVQAFTHSVPRSSLGAKPWSLEPPGLDDLFNKMRAGSVSLRTYLGAKPLRGIMTGYNRAFVLSTEERDAIVRRDAAAADLIQPCLRGQDVKRWSPAWQDLWMIVIPSSGDRKWPWSGMEEKEAEFALEKAYPGLHAHFRKHEARLRKRRDQGEYWWELRSCDYYAAFRKPKLLYTDITWRPEIAFAPEPVFFVNTVYMWPADDMFLLGVMNSPLLWSYFWRHAQHGKDEALRLFTEMLENVPVPRLGGPGRREIATRVEEMVEIARERNETTREIVDWLRMEFGVEKPGRKLAAAHQLSRGDWVDEVRKRVPGKKLSPSSLAQLRAAYAERVEPLGSRASREAELEREVADLVNDAYGLTQDDVALLWATAPPRMPAPAPVLAGA